MPRSTGPNVDAERGSREQTTIRRWVSKLVAIIIPASVRTRAVSVSVRTPLVIERDQPMEFQVTFRNWLPVPFSIPTKARPWYWQLDGVHDADVTEPDPEDPDSVISNERGALTFASFETKVITGIWNGRMRVKADGPLLPVECGEHVLEIEVTTTAGGRMYSSQTFKIVEDNDEQYANDD